MGFFESRPMGFLKTRLTTKMILPHFQEITKHFKSHPSVLAKQNTPYSINYMRVATMGSGTPARAETSLPLSHGFSDSDKISLPINTTHQDLYFIPNCLTTNPLSGAYTQDRDILEYFYTPLDLDDYQGPRIDFIKSYCSMIWTTSEGRQSALLPVSQRIEVEQAKSIINALGVDAGTYNPSRLLRWPGSYNAKRGYQGRLELIRDYSEIQHASIEYYLARMDLMSESTKLTPASGSLDGGGGGGGTGTHTSNPKVSLSYHEALKRIKRGWKISGVHKGNQDYHMVRWCGEMAGQVANELMTRTTAVKNLTLLQQLGLEERFPTVEEKYIKKLDQFIARDREAKRQEHSQEQEAR